MSTVIPARERLADAVPIADPVTATRKRAKPKDARTKGNLGRAPRSGRGRALVVVVSSA